MPTLIINKYILTENARASKKNTAHTWRQEMRYTQSRGQPKREVHRPITDLQNQRLTSQIQDCHRDENSYFELFLKK